MRLATLMHKQDVYDLEVRHRNDICLRICPANCEISVRSCRRDAHLGCSPANPTTCVVALHLWCSLVKKPPSQVALKCFQCVSYDANASLVGAETFCLICCRGDSWVLSTSGSNGTALKALRPTSPSRHVFFFVVSAQSFHMIPVA